MKEIIVTDHAPKPIGPYSQAIRANGFLFAAQIALENLQAILTHAGLTLSHVVKTSVFLKDPNDSAAMNEIYAKYFPAAAPARSIVQAAGLPKNALIEIELVAVL